ncbi:MAG: PPC domain-containing DNA-binding protein [Chloroflexota bacterium]
MRFQQFGERYIIRLEQHETVIDELVKFLSKENVEFANVSAAGAVQWIELEYWNAKSKSYESRTFDEQLEVVSFQGNASLKDGKPMLHIHGVFGRENFSVVAGHVKEARAYPTLEVWLRTENIPVRRVKDEGTGLFLMDLPEQLR